MIAEAVGWVGHKILGDTPPDGKDYWAARYWDRDAAEKHPVLASAFLRQKETIAGYLRQYGSEAKSVIEFACGTGEFTKLTAELTPAVQIVALDVSAQGLEMTKAKVSHENLKLIRGDFWADNGIVPGDLVMCVDAIHHLGNLKDVLARIRTFVEPGGVFIGNIIVGDHFHEFGQVRYGKKAHLANTSIFALSALLYRLSGGQINTGYYRTRMSTSKETKSALAETFSEVLDVSVDRYFMAFAVRG